MSRNIHDPRFAVALTKCYFCNEGDRIVINTLLTERVAASVDEMHGKIINMEPCQKCQDLMKRGVIIITIDEEKSGEGWNKPDGTDHWMPNPYRSGGWFVVTDDFIRKAIDEPMQSWGLKHRWMFVSHQWATMVGLFEAKPLETDEP